ncbi:MAG: solute:sodium symporter family transporter [Fuerstiella sp.]
MSSLQTGPNVSQTTGPDSSVTNSWKVPMPLTILSFLFFTGLVAALTWRITHRDDHDTSSGYFLAGRSLTFPLIAGSLLLTNLSTEQMVGLNGAAFTDGLCVMVWEVVCVVALVFMAWFFLPRFLKSGVATVPEYLEIRFDHQTQVITNIIFLVAYVGILLPIILYTGATGMMGILNVPSMLGSLPESLGVAPEKTALWLIVIMVGIIGSIYALFGGLRTVAVSDTLNGIGLFAGGFMITGFALAQIGGDGGISAGATELWEQQRTRFNSIGSSDSSVPFGTIFSGIFLLNLFYWTTNQQIIQRTFGASSLAEGQKGVLLTGALKLLGPVYLVIPGMLAFSAFGYMLVSGVRTPIKDVITEDIAVVVRVDGQEQLLYGAEAAELLNTSDAGEAESMIGTVVPLEEHPASIERVLAANTVITQNADGDNEYTIVKSTAPYVAPRHADKAYGKLVNMVLPAPLTGFFAAAMIGAILSSFNSALNSSCTLFSLGLYKNVFRPGASEHEVVRSGKVFGWIVAVLAMGIAPLLANTTSIFGYLQKMNGMYFIPIFAVVLIGMLTKRVPAIAARIGLVTGFAVIAVGYFVPPFDKVVASMHEFQFLGVVFSWLLILMLVIGEVAPRETEFQQQDVGAVDMTPWKHARTVGLLLIATVLTIYATFADFSVLSNG